MDAFSIAYQGEPGAYSEEAILTHLRVPVTALAYSTLRDVFNSVLKGKADYGLLPVENTLGHLVVGAYDLLLETNAKVCGEIVHRITHCLLSRSGVKLASIKRVYSHPQALAQCSRYLEKLGLRALPEEDTAGSARKLRSGELPGNSAVIASRRAGEIYTLKVLARGIEDNPNNYTRFLLLGRRDSEPTGRDKTSIIFSTLHRPGALYRALEPFAVRNINLTSIHSQGIRARPWEYNFFIDFAGHRSDSRVKQALKELDGRTSFLKVLGSYPRFSRSRKLRHLAGLHPDSLFHRLIPAHRGTKRAEADS